MDSQVQEVKDKLNIVDIVGQYVQLRRAGKNYMAKCPFHKERTASFYVSPERGTYICFGCGEKGDVLSFVQKMEGIDFPTALKQLAEKAGVKLHRTFTKNAQDADTAARTRAACEAAAAFFQQELQKRPDVLSYLRSRGVKEETISAWRLGYAPPLWEELGAHLRALGFTNEEIVGAGLAIKSEKKAGEVYDRFRGRIMFPIADAGGSIVGFSGRFFERTRGSKEEGEPAKYVNSPETELFKKSKTLYGLDKAKGHIRKSDCILLVEGQFDVILAHQSGLPIAVALSGTALTGEHLILLSRLSKRLIVALDADAAGIRAGLKSAYMAIAAGFEVKVPTFPQGKDPADLAKENPELLKAAIRTSQSAVEFFLNVLWPTARDERSYQKIVESSVLPLISAMESSIEQEHFSRVVAQRLGVSQAAVLQEIRKIQARVAPVNEEPQLPPQEAALSPLERAAGMLLFYFEGREEIAGRLGKLVGTARLEKLTAHLSPQAEQLRFRFEREMGGELSEQAVADDLFKHIELLMLDEAIAAAQGDARTVSELVRRKHELLQ